MPLERSWLASPDGGERPMVEVCGVGAAGARRAALRLADLGIGALASWGMAAGLDPRLSPGVVVIPDHVIEAPARGYTPDPGWRRRLQNRLGEALSISGDPLANSPTILETVGAKAAIFERTGAAAADMESAAVAQVAADHGLSFLVIRAILDPAAVALPRGLARAVDDGGRVRAVRLVVRGLLEPRDWPRWPALLRGFVSARRAMRAVATLSAPDLALSD